VSSSDSRENPGSLSNSGGALLATPRSRKRLPSSYWFKMDLSCPRCSQRLEAARFASGQSTRCPACNSDVEAYVFPAFEQDALSRPEIHLAGEGEAVCFFHSRYRAISPCDNCGRFLCGICLLTVGSRRLCAECLSHARRQKDEEGLVNHAPLFDNVALVLVTLPVVSVMFGFLTVLSAPVSLFLALVYWSRQWSLLPRSRLRFVIAIILAILLMAGWAVLVYYLITSVRSHI
jgi:hypothetical protein